MSSAPPEYGDFGPDSVLDEVFEAFGGRIMDGADVSSIPHPYRVEREELLPRELR